MTQKEVKLILDIKNDVDMKKYLALLHNNKLFGVDVDINEIAVDEFLDFIEGGEVNISRQILAVEILQTKLIFSKIKKNTDLEKNLIDLRLRLHDLFNFIEDNKTFCKHLRIEINSILNEYNNFFKIEDFKLKEPFLGNFFLTQILLSYIQSINTSEGKVNDSVDFYISRNEWIVHLKKNTRGLILLNKNNKILWKKIVKMIMLLCDSGVFEKKEIKQFTKKKPKKSINSEILLKANRALKLNRLNFFKVDFSLTKFSLIKSVKPSSFKNRKNKNEEILVGSSHLCLFSAYKSNKHMKYENTFDSQLLIKLSNQKITINRRFWNLIRRWLLKNYVKSAIELFLEWEEELTYTKFKVVCDHNVKKSFCGVLNIIKNSLTTENYILNRDVINQLKDFNKKALEEQKLILKNDKNLQINFLLLKLVHNWIRENSNDQIKEILQEWGVKSWIIEIFNNCFRNSLSQAIMNLKSTSDTKEFLNSLLVVVQKLPQKLICEDSHILNSALKRLISKENNLDINDNLLAYAINIHINYKNIFLSEHFIEKLVIVEQRHQNIESTDILTMFLEENLEIFINHFYDSRGRIYSNSKFSPIYNKIIRVLLELQPNKQKNLKVGVGVEWDEYSSLNWNKIKYWSCKNISEIENFIKNNLTSNKITVLTKIGFLLKNQISTNKVFIDTSEFFNLGIKTLIKFTEFKKTNCKEFLILKHKKIDRIADQISSEYELDNFETIELLYLLKWCVESFKGNEENISLNFDATGSTFQCWGYHLGLKSTEYLRVLNLEGSVWCDNYAWILEQFKMTKKSKVSQIKHHQYFLKRKFVKKTIMIANYNSTLWGSSQSFNVEIQKNYHDKWSESTEFRIDAAKFHKELFNFVNDDLFEILYIKNKIEFLQNIKPENVCVDNYLNLTYYKNSKIRKERIKIKSFIWNFNKVSLGDKIDEFRTKRALPANLMQATDAYLLRSILKTTAETYPIHDCIIMPIDDVSLNFYIINKVYDVNFPKKNRFSQTVFI